MKKIFLILPILFLSGCSIVTPVKRNFPEVPAELMQPCPSLKTIEPGTEQLSTVIKIVADNYSQYHECRIKVDSWKEWYDSQKKIFEEVK